MSTARGGMQPSGAGTRLHAIDVWFENRPGAMYRLLGVVDRHGCAIEQLVVAPTGSAGVSRATLVVRAADVRLMLRQMCRLLPVLYVARAPDAVPSSSSTTPTAIAECNHAVAEVFTHPVITHSQDS